MGRRQGTVDPRVVVSVSEEMRKLRNFQNILNGFWQSSELAYGFFLSQNDSLFSDRERSTIELLGHIESNVWYPNNQGRIKHDEKIGTTLNQVEENTVHVYRATLLSFCTAFETYLDERVGPLLDKKNRSWGPFIKTLSITPLLSSTYPARPVRLRTVLCADLVREIRNKIVHETFSVPRDVHNPIVDAWKIKYIEDAIKAGWAEKEANNDVKYAIDHYIGQAARHVNEGENVGKQLPIELFYMIFGFSNLDSLAFEIEEALLHPNARTGFSVTRKKAAVDRPDLIIESVIDP
jgi:hypothetical protein